MQLQYITVPHSHMDPTSWLVVEPLSNTLLSLTPLIITYDPYSTCTCTCTSPKSLTLIALLFLPHLNPTNKVQFANWSSLLSRFYFFFFANVQQTVPVCAWWGTCTRVHTTTLATNGTNAHWTRIGLKPVPGHFPTLWKKCRPSVKFWTPGDL